MDQQTEFRDAQDTVEDLSPTGPLGAAFPTNDPNSEISWELISKLQYQADRNSQFSILELMSITGICAFSIVAISKVGLLATLFLFLASASASWVLANKLTDPTKLRLWNQMLWGILMPIGCVFGDPFVFGFFHNGIPRELYTFALASYVFMAWQMLWMVASWYVRPERKLFNELIAGSFFAGSAFALCIAVCLLPISIAGLFALGIGVLGLTPWFTASVYFKSARMHLRRAKQTRGRVSWTIVVLSCLFPIGIAIVVMFLTQSGLIEVWGTI